MSYSKAWFGFRMGVGNVIELGQQSHGLSPSCEKLVTVSPDPSLSLEALSFSKAG